MSGPAPFVLASRSPRRAALLRAAGFAFEVAESGVDEEALGRALASPSRRAVVLARAKARAVAARMAGRTVVGADTLVLLDAEELGKPRDADHALWMLSRLSGRAHEVVTGVAVVAPDGAEATGFAATLVEFARWPAAALVAYARSASPLDKAGAYGIQDEAGAHVLRVAGPYDNVVGLPVGLVGRLLARATA